MTAVGDSASPAAAVVRELLDLGLLTVDDAVASGLVATDVSMSHRSFTIRVGGDPRLFVKQADPIRSQGRDLATEAAVYRIAQSSTELAAVVPRCRLVGKDASLIVLDAVAGTPLSATPLAFGHAMAVDHASAHSILCRYGNAVGRAHQVRPPPLGRQPWLLAALEPGWGSYAWLPDPCRDLLMRLARRPAAREGFRRAASSWRGRGLVHGDLRWANVLVALDADPPRVWLVDWELACLGDPAWDIASFLADLLASAGLRGLEGWSPELWPAAHAFLGGYRSSAPAEDWPALMRRTVAFTGVRLVQTLTEYGHHDPPLLAAMEPILLPWSQSLLACPPTIVAELSRDAAQRCSCSR